MLCALIIATQLTCVVDKEIVMAGRGPMARTLREVIAAAQEERRAKVAAAHTQRLTAEEQRLIAEEQNLIAEKNKRQLEEAERVLELDRNLIVIAVLIFALPIIAALVAMLTALAVGYRF